MKTCVFIVSFPRDYQLLQWSVQSIRKFMRGDYDIVVVVPSGGPQPELQGARVVNVDEPPGKGFLTQMCVKCEADIYAPGYDHYVHWDSDCILTAPSSITEFAGVCYYGTYQSLFRYAPHMKLWQHAVRKCLGFLPEHEFMRCFPISFPASVYPSTRKRVETVTRRAFSQYVFSTRDAFPQTFAEFNTLGAWGFLEHREEMQFRDWSKGPAWGWDRVHQYHGPSGPDLRMAAGSAAGHTARETATRLGLL